jgi:hypothetical protein
MFTYAQVKEFWSNYFKNSEQFIKDFQKDLLDSLKNNYIQSFNSSPITSVAILTLVRRALTIFSSTVPSAIISI